MSTSQVVNDVRFLECQEEEETGTSLQMLGDRKNDKCFCFPTCIEQVAPVAVPQFPT